MNRSIVEFNLGQDKIIYPVTTAEAVKYENSNIKDTISNINLLLNNMKYETAGGTATAITLTLPEVLENGMPKKFIAGADNGGAATTINGYPVYKPGSTNPVNLKKDGAYEVYFNGPGNCFFLKASAKGTATPEQVLAGVPFSNEYSTDQIGTMPNIGQQISTINAGGKTIISKGYHDGTGYVQANSLASQTQANADASKILSGYSAWVNGVKVNGNATIQSLGGKNYKIGTVSSTYNGSYVYYDADTPSGKIGVEYYIDITGFDFVPNVLVTYNSKGFLNDTIYFNGNLQHRSYKITGGYVFEKNHIRVPSLKDTYTYFISE